MVVVRPLCGSEGQLHDTGGRTRGNPGGIGAAKASHDSQRTQNVHNLRVPAFNNTTKIQRKEPPREEERMKIVAGEGNKKREISGSPPFGAPTLRGPTSRKLQKAVWGRSGLGQKW